MKISIIKFDILEQHYLTNPSNGGCTVMHLEKPTLHERCVCYGKDVSFCKAECDDDLNCKGYAKTIDMHNSCAYATDSPCPSKSKCEKHGVGQKGLLIPDGTYGSSFYEHCWIKGKINWK